MYNQNIFPHYLRAFLHNQRIILHARCKSSLLWVSGNTKTTVFTSPEVSDNKKTSVSPLPRVADNQKAIVFSLPEVSGATETCVFWLPGVEDAKKTVTDVFIQ